MYPKQGMHLPLLGVRDLLIIITPSEPFVNGSPIYIRGSVLY